MKTFGKMIALIFVLFHSACNPDETLMNPTVPPSGNGKMVSISTNLAPEVRDYGDGTIFLRWNGSAPNLADKVPLSLSHQAYDFDKNENFEIRDRYFNLVTDDPQRILNGTFAVVALKPTNHSSWKDTLQYNRLPETLPRLLLASP